MPEDRGQVELINAATIQRRHASARIELSSEPVRLRGAGAEPKPVLMADTYGPPSRKAWRLIRAEAAA